MAAIDQRSPGKAGERLHPPTRFLQQNPRNSRLALELSLARGPGLKRPCASRDRTTLLLRSSIRQIVELSTAAHCLSIQRRLLADVFDDQPEMLPLATVNTRVQTAAATITVRSVAALASISEAGVHERSWHEMIVPRADEILEGAATDPSAALERLPGEIVDHLSGALALDQAQLVHAAPLLIRGTAGSVALFVLAGLPH